MIDAQVKLLEQVQYKSQLSPELEREYCVRFGLKAFCALPDAPKPERVKVTHDIG